MTFDLKLDLVYTTPVVNVLSYFVFPPNKGKVSIVVLIRSQINGEY